MKMSRLILLLLMTHFLMSGTTGKIAGKLIDASSGDPLIGANVLIENSEMGTATDINGDFAILNIPPGSINVRAMMIGYEPMTITNIFIAVDKTTRVNFELDVQAIIGSEVTVVASAKVIQFDVTNSEARVTAADLEVLPVTDVSDVIKLQGGVTVDAGGGIHIRGGRSSEVMYMVDGVSMTDVYDGNISVPIENNNIQELQVISGTFNAEYGRAMSGIINLVTKDGGNEFKLGLKGFIGDHYTKDKIFRNVDSYNPSTDQNYELNISGPVPILGDFLSFYSSGRYYSSDGWLGGVNTFTMYGDTLFNDLNGNGYRELAEEFIDTGNAIWDPGESFTDLGNDIWDEGEEYWDQNGNGVYDIGEIYIDESNGQWDPGEEFIDANPNGIWDHGEFLWDSNSNGRNGVWDEGEEFVDLGNGIHDSGENFTDLGNGVYDIGEEFTDNGNGYWNTGEEFWDANNDGLYTDGEIFIDEGNGIWSPGEPYIDAGNGIYDQNEQFVDLGNGMYDLGESFKDKGNGIWDEEETLKTPKFRAMNWREKWSAQNKITLKITPMTKLRLNTIFSHEEYQDYDRDRIMTQAGRNTSYQDGKFIGVSLSHSMSARTFMDFNITKVEKTYESYLFEDPEDPRYSTPDSLYWAQEQGEIPQSIIDQWGETYQIDYWPDYSFGRWGVAKDRFFRETMSTQYKFEITSQVNKYNLLKAGFDYQEHSMELDSYSILDENQGDQVFTPFIPELNDVPLILEQFYGITLSGDIPSWVESFHPNRTYYKEEPKEFSAFLQDKIEYGDMIINIGLRYDWFDPNSWVPTNIHEPYWFNPRNPRLDSLIVEGKFDELFDINWGDTSHYVVSIDGVDTTFYTYADFGGYTDQPDLKNDRGFYKRTKKKSLISPRLGIAYPISDRGVIHFSYGYFFQIPKFELLYQDSGYKMSDASGQFGIFGNPDLEPQKTVSYELGLQQEISSQIKMEITGYYRDVRDWVASGIPNDLGGGASYYTFVNKDYSNVRGLILSFDKRFSDYHSWHIDYTYQVAEGSNSDPSAEYGARLDNAEPARFIVPLDWDQSQTLNGDIYFGYESYGLDILVQYGSGYPYTPDLQYAQTSGQTISTLLSNNSRRKQPTLNFDLKLFKKLSLPNDKYGKIYMNIYNLFDKRNEITIWSDTGRTNRTLGENQAQAIADIHTEPLRPNTITEYFSRPEWYSSPRNIQIGFELQW